MIIEKELLFEGSKGEATLLAMFDSGASYSCIRPDHAEQLETPVVIRHPFKIETASEGHFIEVEQRISLDFYIEDYHFSDEFVLVPNLSEAIIIGAGTLQKWRFKLDFDKDDVIFDPRVTKLRLV